MGNPIWLAFRDSGVVGKSIYIVLFFASVWVWTVMVHKFLLLRRVERAAELFLNHFRRLQGNPLSLAGGRAVLELNPFLAVYQRGCQEIQKRREEAPAGDTDLGEARSRIQQAMEETGRDQIAELEKHLIFLGTAAAAGPLFGIFGTLWGVMLAFRQMGIMGAATLDAVAPGISEALMTTVVGLGIAIPALLAYNYLTHAISRFSARLDRFVAEFLSAAVDLGKAGQPGEAAKRPEKPLVRPKVRARATPPESSTPPSEPSRGGPGGES